MKRFAWILLLVAVTACHRPEPTPVPPAPIPPAPAPIPPKPAPTQDQLASDGLIEAAKAFPGSHVCDGPMHPALQAMAVEHSHYQADHNKCGHQGFDGRYETIYTTLQMGAAEIAAQSWPNETNSSMRELGDSMFKAWRQSPGHWQTARSKHAYYGAGMAKSKKGIWFATILVAD